MAIKIQISNLVGFKVEGTINDESGTAKPFDFRLTCARITPDEIAARLAGDYGFASILDFMLDINRGWSSVRDGDDKPIDYSEDAFRSLCATIPGVLFLAFTTYREQVGARSKN